MLDYSKILLLTEDDILRVFFPTVGVATSNIWQSGIKRAKFYFYKLFGQYQQFYLLDLNLIPKYEKIIITETMMEQVLIEDIRRLNPKAEIKFWMLNIVSDYGDWRIKKLQQMGIEVFSFDKDDCKKYGLTYGNQIYPFAKQELQEPEEKVACYFCGKDKGRMPMVVKLQQYLERQGLSYNLKVRLDKTSTCKPGSLAGIELLEKSIDYGQILEDINKAECIVELVQKGQNGLTWRPYEALFYDKKLITNNESIVEYDFYHPDNIFVIKKGQLEGLAEFLQKPLVPISDTIKERYTYKAWLEHLWE